MAQQRTYFLILLAAATASSACYREAAPVEPAHAYAPQPRPASGPQTVPTPRLRWSGQPAPSTVHANVAIADSPQSFLLFGGSEQKVFLGCLDCSEHEQRSIKNKHGDFGSEHSDRSIFNRHSDYGSRHSNYGVCNEHASEPPVVVDGEGHYFGRLTTNRFADQVQDPALVSWLTAVCEHQR